MRSNKRFPDSQLTNFAIMVKELPQGMHTGEKWTLPDGNKVVIKVIQSVTLSGKLLTIKGLGVPIRKEEKNND